MKFKTVLSFVRNWVYDFVVGLLWVSGLVLDKLVLKMWWKVKHAHTWLSYLCQYCMCGELLQKQLESEINQVEERVIHPASVQPVKSLCGLFFCLYTHLKAVTSWFAHSVCCFICIITSEARIASAFICPPRCRREGRNPSDGIGNRPVDWDKSPW